jgi:hypothetical protein
LHLRDKNYYKDNIKIDFTETSVQTKEPVPKVEAENELVAAEIKEQSLPVVEQATGEEQTSQDEESDDNEYFPEEDGDSVYDEDSSNQEEDSEADSGPASPEPSTSRVQAAAHYRKSRVTVPRPLRPYVKATPKFPYQPSAEWDEVFAEFPKEFIEHVYRQKIGKFHFEL